MQTSRFSLRCGAFAAALLIGSAAATLCADDPAAPAPKQDLSEAEQKFVEQLAGRTMVGSFTIDGAAGAAPKEERYEIGAVTKMKDDLWTVEARIKYGKVDARVPVPVNVYWAGDTPMISVTNLTIPLVGSEFSARVLFHGDRYAGTWQHGQVGGHMWGRIVETAEQPAAATPTQGK